MRRHGLGRARADGVLTLGRRATEVERGRRHVAEACRHYPDDVAFTATLLASELITNAVRYGAGTITLLVTHGRDEVRIDVSDESPAEARPRRARLEDEGGRGLMIVDTLASSWGMENLPQGGGKSVWFTLSVTAPR